MRKHSTYKPKLNRLGFAKLAANFASNANEPLSPQIVAMYKTNFNNLHKNLLKNTANMVHIMALHGVLGTVQMMYKNSNYLIDELDKYEVVLSIADKIHDILDRSTKDNLVGYLSDDEKQAVINLNLIFLKSIEIKHLTNRQYENIMVLLEKDCIKHGRTLINETCKIT